MDHRGSQILVSYLRIPVIISISNYRSPKIFHYKKNNHLVTPSDNCTLDIVLFTFSSDIVLFTFKLIGLFTPLQLIDNF